MDENVTFQSAGDTLRGLMGIGADQPPRPTVILLDGFPNGQELSVLDLPEPIAATGWNVLRFYYRGNWQSEGIFNLANMLEDAAAAVAFARSAECQERFGCDGGPVALVGHSLGGWLALITAATNPAVARVAALSAGNLGPYGRRSELRDAFREFYEWATGEDGSIKGVSPDEFVADLKAGAEKWDFANHAEALARIPVLLTYGAKDEYGTLEEHMMPLANALERRQAPHLQTAVLDTDHYYSHHRAELSEIVRAWLRGEELPPPQ